MHNSMNSALAARLHISNSHTRILALLPLLIAVLTYKTANHAILHSRTALASTLLSILAISSAILPMYPGS